MDASNEGEIRCKQCRNVLFNQEQLGNHDVGQQSFSKFSEKPKDVSSLSCNSYFLEEPLEWMDLTGQTLGKLYCPSCSSKIGTFDWSGSQCSCGTWISPSIQISKSKVDREAGNILLTFHEDGGEEEEKKSETS